MPFQEKSAWVMSLALFVTGVLYFASVLLMSGQEQLASPNLPILVTYTIALIVISVVGHIGIAVFATKEANAGLDERERRIFERAGHVSGNILGCGVVLSLLLYLFSRNGDLLFYTVFGSLLVGQLLEYFAQIYFFRRFVA